MEFQNAILEYRLQKLNDYYEAIYHYPDIDLPQILARRACEFFIKDGVTYKQLFSAIEGELFVIYVEVFEQKPIEQQLHTQDGIRLEIRLLNSRQNYPLVTSEYVSNHLDVLSVIDNMYTYMDGKEWERDSAEIDEDRNVYVLYVTATGNEV